MTTHNDHNLAGTSLPAKGTYLFDGCPRCEEHSKTLYNLDDGTLKWLAEMADILKFYFQEPTDYEPNDPAYERARQAHDLSMNERRAITHLRLYGRIVFRSQITEEVCKTKFHIVKGGE